MRTYPQNSPQAAARIVAMTMMADGHVSKTEMELFERSGARWALGLQPGELQAVVQSYCEDLLMDAYAGQGTDCGIDRATVQSLLREIDNPQLRAKVQHVCKAVVHSDAHIAQGENMVLKTAEQLWGLTASEPAASIAPRERELSAA